MIMFAAPQIVKYGGKEERNGIAVELDGLYKQMLESKYSKVSIGRRLLDGSRLTLTPPLRHFV